MKNRGTGQLLKSANNLVTYLPEEFNTQGPQDLLTRTTESLIKYRKTITVEYKILSLDLTIKEAGMTHSYRWSKNRLTIVIGLLMTSYILFPCPTCVDCVGSARYILRNMTHEIRVILGEERSL